MQTITINHPKGIAQSCDAVFYPRYPDLPKYTGTEKAVFVNGDYFEDFLKMIKKDMELCVVHNSDKTFGNFEANQLANYADTIHAINADCFDHYNVTQIPIGFSDYQYEYLQTYPLQTLKRDILIYSNFTITTNPEERFECHQADIKNVTRSMFKTQGEYYHDLCRSKYVLCPEGTGMDTHRIYEALYCGAMPVVKRNPLAPMYEAMGGIIIVDRWEDLNELI